MTNEQYRNWIRTQLLDISARRYPNSPHKQMLYQIGFLQAQLAQAMTADTNTAYRFKSAVDNKQ
jgi:hypothetical protein